MFRAIAILLLLSTAALTSALPMEKTTSRTFQSKCPYPRLICTLSPANDSNVSGNIFFEAVLRKRRGIRRCEVRIRGTVRGLTGRRHGFHIHEYGDISNSTGSSTGGHFLNPFGIFVKHGLPNDAERHWGDFGNLRAVGGVATYNRVDRVISIPGIIGRGITVHADRDVGAAEQPTGASGSRIGFCVIGIANPSSL